MRGKTRQRQVDLSTDFADLCVNFAELVVRQTRRQPHSGAAYGEVHSSRVPSRCSDLQRMAVNFKRFIRKVDLLIFLPAVLCKHSPKQ